MKIIFRNFLYTFLLGFSFLSLNAQYVDFDKGVPANWNAVSEGSLSTTSARSKIGSNSLVWNYSAGSSLIVNNPEGMTEAINLYRGGIQFWIYNDEPVSEADLRVEFRKGNDVAYYFDYGLNFSGWRACWIRFKEDMYGSKHRKDLDNMRFVSPGGTGKLYIDRLTFPSQRINDQVTPDEQLPYINPENNENHWGALWYWYSNYEHVIELAEFVTDKEQEGLELINEKVYEYSLGTGVTNTALTNAKNAFGNLNITEINGVIQGRAFVSNDEFNASYNDVRMADLDPVLRDLSRGWVQHKDKEA